ncbi:unnamed protein product [Rotaria sp. Silwood2]|nr:unnamed protein product [Rotaria sp. Silwood2]CAF2881888.1 unnamed protein product [Rotaria sp. Silwood2]CAF4025270.1 unnamed protein product [Rotaria sp. Silwood2]CAF4205015.1 unnamed protein product [Rotaria sp. Silwood2]CAF4437307.1 unnamed protein product [Rotaria sp. Silwood2]
MKQNPNLYPPLRAHISKRDTKSFFLHWIPNPLNEHRSILGYRIYIDDILKGAIDSGRFEAIIDYIRDEGEYKIKLRTYNEHGESPDSNIVIARFRRQHSTTLNTEATTTSHRTQSNHIFNDINQTQINDNFIISSREPDKTPVIREERLIDIEQQQQQQCNSSVTPEKNTTKSDEHISPLKISPHLTVNDNIISRKPPKSPTSSPNRTDKTSPNNKSCSKTLFTHNNNNNDSSTVITTKRSPTRTGVMSRLAKSPHRIKRNNILTNPLPIEISNNLTDGLDESKIHGSTAERMITFKPDLISSNHGHILAQKFPIGSSDISNSMTVNHLLTSSDTFSSNYLPPPPPPIPPRIARPTIKTLIDQQS